KNQSLGKNAHSGTMTNDDKAHLASLSTKELEQLHGIKEGVQQLVENLSSEQFSKLVDKDSGLTDQEKSKLKTARYKSLSDAVTEGNDAEVKRLLKGATKKDFAN